MTEITVLIGLPGVGKSTYADMYIKARVTNGKMFWAYCSSDRTRKKLYGDESIQGKPDTVFRNLHAEVERHIKAGTNVVYDATNVSRKNRAQILAIGKKYGCIIHAVIVWAPVDVCISRDASRGRTVGKDVIMRMLKRFEVPYFDEGFDTVEVYNTVEGFNEEEYNNQLLESMKIDHENPHHTYGVHEHCVSAADVAKKLHYSSLIVEAARYHDCGKPLAKFIREGETVAHYYNHDNIGGYLVLGLSKFAFVMIIPWMISNHMQPFFNSKYYKNLDISLKVPLDQLHDCDLAAH